MTPIKKIICCADGITKNDIGGAEKTLKVLIEAFSPDCKIKYINSEDLTRDILSQHSDHIWIFGNYYHLIESNELKDVTSLIKNYFVVEFDYKFLPCRNLEIHKLAYGKKFEYDSWSEKVDHFLNAAKKVFFMSIKQMEKHVDNLEILDGSNCIAINSCFEDDFFDVIEEIKDTPKDNPVGVYGQRTPQKGFEAAIQYCQSNLIYNFIDIYGESDYKKFLTKLCSCENLVFLPLGGDSCPRLVIEAKLLGVNLILNDNIEHIGDPWWSLDRKEMIKFLKSTPERFKRAIEESLK